MNKDLAQFGVGHLKEMLDEDINPLDGFSSVPNYWLHHFARIALAGQKENPEYFIVMRLYGTYQELDVFLALSDAEKRVAEDKDGVIIPCYTTPQSAHTEQDDTRRMNWLVSQNVEVRTPMPYGSHARFVAQCDSDDCEEYHTTLREQVDKAMLAAPKPERK